MGLAADNPGLNPQIFDVRWIYASSIMTAIGGGGVCYSATRFLVGASLVSEKNRYVSPSTQRNIC